MHNGSIPFHPNCFTINKKKSFTKFKHFGTIQISWHPLIFFVKLSISCTSDDGLFYNVLSHKPAMNKYNMVWFLLCLRLLLVIIVYYRCELSQIYWLWARHIVLAECSISFSFLPFFYFSYLLICYSHFWLLLMQRQKEMEKSPKSNIEVKIGKRRIKTKWYKFNKCYIQIYPHRIVLSLQVLSLAIEIQKWIHTYPIEAKNERTKERILCNTFSICISSIHLGT